MTFPGRRLAHAIGIEILNRKTGAQSYDVRTPRQSQTNKMFPARVPGSQLPLTSLSDAGGSAGGTLTVFSALPMSRPGAPDITSVPGYRFSSHLIIIIAF